MWVKNIRDLVPNYDELSPKDKIKASEVIYRRQLKWTWGKMPGETPIEAFERERAERKKEVD